MADGYSRLALRAFDLVFGPWEARRIAAVRLAGLPRELPPDRPLLIAANHVSWWDGFTLRRIHRLLRPDAPIYTLMLRRELERHRFLGRLGAIGIDPDSPASVSHAFRLLERRARERPDTIILYFPQGRIWPSFRRPLGFRRGIELVVRRVAPAVVLPVAQHHEPLNAPAPTVFVSVAGPLDVTSAAVTCREIEAAVEAQADRILAFLSRHGEDAAQRWPGPFDPLPAPPAAVRRTEGASSGPG